MDQKLFNEVIMGFDLMLIATNANGLSIPFGAKCCVCHLLLDDGICLSGCHHNACFRCMKKRAFIDSTCPLDGQQFQMKRYRHLSEEIEEWLRDIKLKCQWFDGRNCTATGIAIRNAHRHQEICGNNPKIKLTEEQRNVVKLVQNWMQNNEIIDCESMTKRENNAMNRKYNKQLDSFNAREECFGEKTPRKGFNGGNDTQIRMRTGYGYRPVKRTIGYHFFTNSTKPEVDFNWRN